MVRFAPCLAAALFVLTSPMVHAQSTADIAIAKQQFMLGKTYYDQAAYEKALGHFKESYRLSKRHVLLYNIARCYESLARLREAIDNYRLYLKRTKKKDATLSARIHNLEARLKAQQPKPVDKPIDKPVDKPIDKPIDRPADKPVDEPGAVTPPVTPPSDEPADPRGGGGWMKITGWTLIGVGGASIVGSFIFGAAAAGKASTVEDAYATGAYDWADIKTFEDKGKTFQALQVVTMIVGVLAAGGGAALLFFAPSASSESDAAPAPPAPSAQITPMIGGNTIGLSTRFTF